MKMFKSLYAVGEFENGTKFQIPLDLNDDERILAVGILKQYKEYAVSVEQKKVDYQI